MKKVYKKRVLVDLSARMRRAGATNVALATAAGVAANTVANARAGREILVSLAGHIDMALQVRTFSRDRRGAR